MSYLLLLQIINNTLGSTSVIKTRKAHKIPDRITSSLVSYRNKEDKTNEGIQLSEVKETDTNKDKEKTKLNIQTRKSERIRKQRYVISPEDIGNNDDEDDHDYK